MSYRSVRLILAVCLFALAGAGASLGQCLVGVNGGGGGLELPQLESTLTNLNFNWQIITSTAEAQALNANVIIDRYDVTSNLSSGSVTAWLNTGKGYIELGDWPDYFPNAFTGFPPGPITVSVNDASSPLAAGLAPTWTGRGFWAYGFSTNYIGYGTNGALPDVIHAQQASNTYDHVASTELVGAGRAVYLGINVYGSSAGPNDTLLLQNAITWSGACGTTGIPTTSNLGLVAMGVAIALAAIFVIARVR